jgi:tRNA pseudouridine38-40 synthase
MTRWKIVIEYDGRPFAGWQRQAEAPSVQQALEEAILAFSGENVRVNGSGRTDAGVHALGQVAHFDLEGQRTSETVQKAMNAHLRPRPIGVLDAQPVPGDFDARLAAVNRVYRYRILNRPAPPALDAGRVWHIVRPLDAPAMHEAAQMLIGHHDFTSFRASECQAKSPVRTLDRFDIAREGNEIVCTAEARSFLHHQVRNIVGTLRLVGLGKWKPRQVREALDARDRRHAGQTAPPEGLYFVRVDFR